MIGRVTNVGMIDYTASYDGERLYLYEQSKLVAEREMKDLTGIVFDGNVIYYITSGNNTIFFRNCSWSRSEKLYSQGIRRSCGIQKAE